MALYHSAKGSVNYTVIGSPTIVDGVVSGFSENDYLKLTSVFNKKQNWEICFSVKNNDSDPTISLSKGIFCMNDWTDRLFVVNKAFQFHFNDQDGSHYLNTSTLNNFEGEVKVIHNNNHISLLTKNKTETGWILQAEEDTNFSDTNFGVMFIGLLNKANLERPYPGSIDLNHSYITVNGQPWFGNCPVEVKKHQLMGPVGYTVVGSPTIKDGVVSGISSGNLLQVAQQVAPQNITERVAKIKLNASAIRSGRYHNVFYGPASMSLVFYAAADTDKINSVSCYLPGSSSSLFYGLAALVADTWYWFKYTYDGTTASLYKSTDGSNYTLLGSVSATISGSVANCFIGNRWNGDASFFDGEIDMNETYFKVNGKLWFYQPAPTKYIVKDNKLVFASQDLYLAGPTTYTKVGNPVIEDCVASGFENGVNYLVTPSYDKSDKTIEFFTKITTGDTIDNVNGEAIIGNNGGNQNFGVWIVGSSTVVDKGKFCATFYYKNTSNRNTYIYLRSPIIAQPNTTYYLQTIYDLTGSDKIITIAVSTDGIVYNRTSVTVSNFLSYNDSSSSSYIGAKRMIGQGTAFNGSIDLNQTYIKVNDQLWFYGKNYASKNIAPVPAGYTYGNTTTQSIGYVDMRTQQFTAAPTGATLGRDE